MTPRTVSLPTDEAFRLAFSHQQSGKLGEAESIYRQILAQHPDHGASIRQLGVMAHQLGKSDAAIALLRRATEVDAGDAEALNNLGVVYASLRRFEPAIDCYRRASTIDSQNPAIFSNLASSLSELGLVDEAIANCRKAIELSGSWRLANALSESGSTGLTFGAETLANNTYSRLLFLMHAHPRFDARGIFDAAREWASRFETSLAPAAPATRIQDDPSRRLRIGYVSSDFRHHAISRFIVPVLLRHDRSQYQVFAYSNVQKPDDMTLRISRMVDVFRDIAPLSDPQASDLIRSDKIDILVDLNLHTANNRLLVFARKPAPVQAIYLAYCSTSGLAGIDYRISDPYLDPPDFDQSVYTEKTIRLPETYWCQEPPAVAPAVNELPALEAGVVSFACLNSIFKLSDLTLETFAGVLQAVPGSRLLLCAPEGAPRERIRNLFNQHGVLPGRIFFTPQVPLDAYYRLHHFIDIGLDSFPYGGGTTTLDALWMGVPVVALIGSTAVGRGGYSLLSNIGLPELAARTPEQFITVARDLAQDLARLQRLRAGLRAQISGSVLNDDRRFMRNLEAAFRKMWSERCLSNRP